VEEGQHLRGGQCPLEGRLLKGNRAGEAVEERCGA